MTEPTRRFPPPLSIDEGTESFIIRDANGQALACVNYDGPKGWRDIKHALTRDETRRIAAHIPRLPDLLKRQH
jgi:hypothetical protein